VLARVAEDLRSGLSVAENVMACTNRKTSVRQSCFHHRQMNYVSKAVARSVIASLHSLTKVSAAHQAMLPILIMLAALVQSCSCLSTHTKRGQAGMLRTVSKDRHTEPDVFVTIFDRTSEDKCLL
jgi:hypothetical protein